MAKKQSTSYFVVKILLPPTVISIFSFGIFCVATYLLTKDGEYRFSVGFPYKFYEFIKVHGSDVNNRRWLVVNFFYDAMLFWSISVFGYFYWLKNYYTAKDD